jgi:hypothetical protein
VAEIVALDAVVELRAEGACAACVFGPFGFNHFGAFEGRGLAARPEVGVELFEEAVDDCRDGVAGHGGPAVLSLDGVCMSRGVEVHASVACVRVAFVVVHATKVRKRS